MTFDSTLLIFSQKLRIKRLYIQNRTFQKLSINDQLGPSQEKATPCKNIDCIIIMYPCFLSFHLLQEFKSTDLTKMFSRQLINALMLSIIQCFNIIPQ